MLNQQEKMQSAPDQNQMAHLSTIMSEIQEAMEPVMTKFVRLLANQ
ncbi:hypothetical protein [Bacillus sp. S3]|nr:hypothetical protein [Bacillus sp. S3]